MGNSDFQIPVKMIILSALSALACAGAGAQDSGTLPDVLIQAEEKRPLTREKPPLNLNLKEEAPLESLLKTEDDLSSRIPSEIALSTHFAAGISNSANVAVPSRGWIILPWKGEPVRVFYPKAELEKIFREPDPKAARSKATWELVVSDSEGKIFRKFRGEGIPPVRLDFDGKSEEGKWLNVGQVYTGVITYRGPTGHTHTAMDAPFSLAGISLQKSSGFAVSLAPRSMFEAEKKFSRLSPHGASLLKDAAQIIQRYHPGLALEVAAYLSSSDDSQASSAARTCADELAKRLLLPAKTVSAKGYPGAPDIEERIDILIFNR